MVPRDKATAKFTTPLGKAEGQALVYTPILDMLAGGPASFKALLTGLPAGPNAFGNLVQALSILIHSGQVHLYRCLAETSGRHFAAAMADRLLQGEKLSHLAALNLGTGYPVGLTDLLAVHCLLSGIDSADAMARESWRLMLTIGQRLKKDDRALTDEGENLAELTRLMTVFLSETLPVYSLAGMI